MTTKVVPTDAELGIFARELHDWFERYRKGSLDRERVVRAVHGVIDAVYPADNEEFELTLDFDAPENDPIQMVRGDGYSSPEKWKHTGKRVSGVQTRRFKLARAGDCRNLDEVRYKLAQYGETPEGQWRQAFKAKYSKPDGNGPVGVADHSWVNPFDFVSFPFVYSGGGSSFDWAGHARGEVWRWLVPASK